VRKETGKYCMEEEKSPLKINDNIILKNPKIIANSVLNSRKSEQ
jgi:hypothetical protein